MSRLEFQVYAGACLWVRWYVQDCLWRLALTVLIASWALEDYIHLHVRDGILAMEADSAP